MRRKQDILADLFSHAQKLDPKDFELAAVAIIETEIQIDIRDILESRLLDIARELFTHGETK